MSKYISKFHQEAVQTRENGDFAKSLMLDAQALIDYQEHNEPAGFAESLADRALNLRHLYMKTNDKNYLILARAEMIASVEIAESLEDKTALAIPLFNLAKVYQELKDLDQAVKVYRQAVIAMETNPPESHNRPAVLGDFKVHLALAELENGDQEAVEKVKKAIGEIEAAEEDSYNKAVWLSGAHMNLAKLIHNTNPQEASIHLQKAKEIIEADERLSIRKTQLEKLQKEMVS